MRRKSRRKRSARWGLSMFLGLVSVGLVVGCQVSSNPSQPGGNDPKSPNPTSDGMSQSALSGPIARRVNDEFQRHYKAAEGMTSQAFLKKYAREYHKKLDFQVQDAKYYKEFLSAFGVSAKAKAVLDAKGFVVVPSPAMKEPTRPGRKHKGGGPADIYYRVFAENLPVFVSADSLLHAWHRSFDKILEKTEHGPLFDLVKELLETTLKKLDPAAAGDKDAMFYLAVARALLDETFSAPTAVEAEVKKYLKLIESRQMGTFDFMGTSTTIDFSQFIPRGHYTRSERLKKFFLAMMWLGRTDLVLYNPLPNSPDRSREEAAARSLARALKQSGALPLFQKLNRFYQAFVGKTNTITPERLLALCEKASHKECAGDASGMSALYAREPAPAYSSRVFAGEQLPITMRFFPQRFGYGSWVTNRTTTPRLKPAVIGGRAMAMPMDVAFALGSDRAAKYFAEDFQQPNRENLPATLEGVRKTMASIRPTSLDDTIYNHWLEALMALSKSIPKNPAPLATPTKPKPLAPKAWESPTLTILPVGLKLLGLPGNFNPHLLHSPSSKAYPQVMLTAAWHDRKLEAVLASWAEMRHDTILIIEQSTGGVACQYPKGYVEPVVGIYQSLAQAAKKMAALYKDKAYGLSNVAPCMEHWDEVLKRLISISHKQLASQPTSQDDLDFLNKIADLHDGYAGSRVFDGWYPQLYWHESWRKGYRHSFGDHPSGVSEPIVADVHTDAENKKALEVATGHPALMLVAIDNEGDISLYAGPVASYYSFHVGLSGRLNDNQWNEMLDSGKAPARPPFARAYRAE